MPARLVRLLYRTENSWRFVVRGVAIHEALLRKVSLAFMGNIQFREYTATTASSHEEYIWIETSGNSELESCIYFFLLYTVHIKLFKVIYLQHYCCVILDSKEGPDEFSASLKKSNCTEA